MPTVLRVGPYRFFFFSNEGNEPVHIHVEAGGEYAKFWIRPVILEESRGFAGHELTEIRRIIEANQDLFEQKWNEFFNQE